MSRETCSHVWKAVLDESQPCFMHTNYINGINLNTLWKKHSVPRFIFRIVQTERDPHKVSLALTQQVSDSPLNISRHRCTSQLGSDPVTVKVVAWDSTNQGREGAVPERRPLPKV